jgi:hypothetical protein
MGIFSFLTAPIINLCGDYFTLLLLARSKRLTRNMLAKNRLQVKQLPVKNQTLKPMAAQAWHTFPSEELLNRFSVREQTGLSSEQVALLKTHTGPTSLNKKNHHPVVFLFRPIQRIYHPGCIGNIPPRFPVRRSV